MRNPVILIMFIVLWVGLWFSAQLKYPYCSFLNQIILYGYRDRIEGKASFENLVGDLIRCVDVVVFSVDHDLAFHIVLDIKAFFFATHAALEGRLYFSRI